jgi:acetylornithine deacetylase/succinyl-diaminopimelate desuccinylase-like protein
MLPGFLLIGVVERRGAEEASAASRAAAAHFAFADEAVRETCGTSHRLPSGPLHDAAEMAMAGVPTVMLFVQSLKGISHNKIEDTRREHLDLAVRALDRLAEKTMRWVASTQRSD